MNLCERGGCTAQAKKRFCSQRCIIIARLCAGWEPHRSLTPEQRQIGGKKGGAIAGERRRGRTMRAWLNRVEEQIPRDIADAIGPRELAAIKVLLARTMRRGWKLGYHAGYVSKQYARRKDVAA